MLVQTTLALVVAAGSASAAAIGKSSYGSTEKVFAEDADFGLCIPTMKFEGGLGARSAVEFSFLPTDDLCAGGLPEATNPNIITNRICDQLTTVCGANEPAKQMCREAQTKIRALGTRNKSTADTWNTLLGFGGALTNPDGGIAEPAFAAPVKDLKKKSEKRSLIACSTSVWIDDCTGWPDAVPVVKREAEAAPELVVKREAEAAPESPTKRSTDKSKRQVEFIACATDVWIDDCTGWP